MKVLELNVESIAQLATREIDCQSVVHRSCESVDALDIHPPVYHSARSSLYYRAAISAILIVQGLGHVSTVLDDSYSLKDYGLHRQASTV